MKQLEKHVWFKVLPLFMICSLLSFSMMAQTISVRGIVTEALTGDPIIGANVLVKGTTNGTITGLDGDFQLSNVPSNGTLVFSYLGYGCFLLTSLTGNLPAPVLYIAVFKLIICF